jgi:hypothetical protein
LSVDVQKITVFGAGIHTKAREPQPARDFAEHLISPAAASIIRKRGLDPA